MAPGAIICPGDGEGTLLDLHLAAFGKCFLCVCVSECVLFPRSLHLFAFKHIHIRCRKSAYGAGYHARVLLAVITRHWVENYLYTFQYTDCPLPSIRCLRDHTYSFCLETVCSASDRKFPPMPSLLSFNPKPNETRTSFRSGRNNFSKLLAEPSSRVVRQA